MPIENETIKYRNYYLLVISKELFYNISLREFFMIIIEQFIFNIVSCACQRQQTLNMNNHPKSKNPPNNTKEDKSLLETPARHERQKHKCPSCSQMGQLMCYGCCFQFACEACYTSQHYVECKRKFNQYPITLADITIDQQSKTKRNGKKSKISEKCQRCFENNDHNEYCIRCKALFCGKCIKETHSFGKFSQHTRIKHGQSPNKMKKMETFTTENDQIDDNAMKKSTKFNIEYSQQGPKTKERVSKLYSTPSQKKGKSVAKATSQNQQNTGLVGSIKSKPQNNQSDLYNSVFQQSQPINHFWNLCVRHHKNRTVLTQNFDIVCQQCFQDSKSIVSKIKNIDVSNWINNLNKQSLNLTLQSSLNQFTLKMKQLQAQFARYRHNLLQEFNKKQEILAEKYKSNLFNLQKWQNTYKTNVKNIIQICEKALKIKQNDEKLQGSPSRVKAIKQFQNIKSLKSLLALEQINQSKKQYFFQQEQYQFKVNEINSECFEEMIKTFNFIRKKVQNDNNMNSNFHQKSLSKMNQSNNLRQSRMSNSSLRTDRKTINRDESFQKSNYYQLSNSNNLLKRSMSKEIKQDLGKDISQKVLFQNNSGLKGEKKSYGNIIKKLDTKHIKNSQYFFDNATDSVQKSKVNSRKQPIQLTNYCFKQVKYVDLQNFLTQKLDKIYDQKSSMMQNTKLQERKSTLFKNDMEISTELIDLRQQQLKNNPTSDSRMTYSINILSTNQSNASKMTSQATSFVNSSVNTTNKNKRKSDYMEMRDRLRKPTVMHKIGAK